MTQTSKIYFCSITTLRRDEREWIYDRMSWENGEIRFLMATNMPNIRMCLIYKKETIVTWAYLDLNRKKEPIIGAWTLSSYRRQGLAKIAVEKLLKRYDKRLKNNYPITVWHKATEKIVKEYGYNVYFAKNFRPR